MLFTSAAAPAVRIGGPARAPGVQCGQTIDDPLTAQPWPLRRLAPTAAWPISRGGGVLVAVLDSGVSPDHPKLAGQVRPGTDLVTPGGNGTCDNDGHGTAVAGIIAGRDTTDGPGALFSGIAPDAEILPVRVLPDSRPSTDTALPARIATAIRWAADHGADVINLSLTTPPSAALAAAVRYAQAKNVVLVAAAGNEGGTIQAGQPVYPAAYDGVLAVAGVDRNDQHVSTSNSGAYIDVAAPGLDIVAPATRGDGYVSDPAGGTSFAAAYASGVAALVRSHFPTLDAADVVRRVKLTADPPPAGRDDDVGYGVVDPYRALAAVLDSRDIRTAAPSGGVLPAPAAGDPLRGAKEAAGVIAGSGGLLAGVLLFVVALRRRGRPAAQDQPPILGAGAYGQAARTRETSAAVAGPRSDRPD